MGTSVDVNLSFDDALGVDLDGIPSSFTIDITQIPKIEIDLEPITIQPITLQPITIEPLDVSVRLKEIPSIRTHIPADFSTSISVLGYELISVRLCGEAQVITEPYEPGPCEHCGERRRTPDERGEHHLSRNQVPA